MTKLFLLVPVMISVLFNFLLTNLTVTGWFSWIILILFLSFCGYFVWKKKDELYLAPVALICFILSYPFSKDAKMLVFDLFFIVLLVICYIEEKTSVKVISAITLILAFILFLPLMLITSVIISGGVYEDTHYVSNEGTEAYGYSGGAMDSMHYRLGKCDTLIDAGSFLTIEYSDLKEVSEEEYNQALQEGTWTKKESQH